MKHIKTYESVKVPKFPVLNDKYTEFWNAVKYANWYLVIREYSKDVGWGSGYDEDAHKGRKLAYRKAQFRLYKNYSYDELKKFEEYYDKLYDELYKFFEPYWLAEKSGYRRYGYEVSDDGFSDLLSSVIGRGKAFVKKCIKDPKVPKKMAEYNEYVENFGYLFRPERSEYDDIMVEFDPFYKDVRKFNL